MWKLWGELLLNLITSRNEPAIKGESWHRLLHCFHFVPDSRYYANDQLISNTIISSKLKWGSKCPPPRKLDNMNPGGNQNLEHVAEWSLFKVPAVSIANTSRWKDLNVSCCDNSRGFSKGGGLSWCMCFCVVFYESIILFPSELMMRSKHPLFFHCNRTEWLLSYHK